MATASSCGVHATHYSAISSAISCVSHGRICRLSAWVLGGAVVSSVCRRNMAVTASVGLTASLRPCRGQQAQERIVRITSRGRWFYPIGITICSTGCPTSNASVYVGRAKGVFLPATCRPFRGRLTNSTASYRCRI